VVGEAATTDAALAVVSEVRSHIVLRDLKLSAGSDTEGLELCAALMADNPDLGVLVLTTFIDDHLVLAAIHNGARGYVVKDVDTSALIRAIRDIRYGGSAFDARSAAAMVRGIHAGSQESDNKLTAREQEVLQLLSRECPPWRSERNSSSPARRSNSTLGTSCASSGWPDGPRLFIWPAKWD
jgi:two-component system, NarL family, response regulator DevR